MEEVLHVEVVVEEELAAVLYAFRGSQVGVSPLTKLQNEIDRHAACHPWVPICWVFLEYGMAVEVMRPRINTWGLGMQKPTSTSSRSVDPNLGDISSNEIQSCGL